MPQNKSEKPRLDTTVLLMWTLIIIIITKYMPITEVATLLYLYL